ncbi:hypothetical protein J2Z53_000343 [Clostridium moniliforme]|uniref:Uncharacterized protein n=1 Tax=Clostridium moniliforme TaxID=39489 RepID=A0ABS4EXN5_9CLOT|nr:hypothetical protein [Clostridium moniliforme]MBP1888764.1 hypothetical protein [Clostridium moniliforme]
MKSKHKRIYSKENYNENGFKHKQHWSKNTFTTTTKEPGINESGIEAKKEGF